MLAPAEWHAVRTRSNCEWKVSRHLAAHDIECFVAETTSLARNTACVRMSKRALFPGYVFSRFHKRQSVTVLSAPGTAHIVAFGGVPAAIAEAEIEALRRLVSSGALVDVCPWVRVGSRVRIRSGPLEGVEGFLEQVRSRLRLIVSVHILCRSVAAEIDPSAIEVLRS